MVRVTTIPLGERNFHIFYYLIAGASPEERQHLQLLDKTMYRYLGPQETTSTRPNEGRDDNGLRFDQLKIALKTIGFSKRHVAQNTSCSHPTPISLSTGIATKMLPLSPALMF